MKVWTPTWWFRSDDEPKVKCYDVEHFADAWFMGCPHEPSSHEFLEAARARCDETNLDYQVLDVISSTYFRFWSLTDRKLDDDEGGRRHVEQWPLALIVLAGLRDAGYEVVKRDAA